MLLLSENRTVKFYTPEKAKLVTTDCDCVPGTGLAIYRNDFSCPEQLYKRGFLHVRKRRLPKVRELSQDDTEVNEELGYEFGSF